MELNKLNCAQSTNFGSRIRKKELSNPSPNSAENHKSHGISRAAVAALAALALSTPVAYKQTALAADKQNIESQHSPNPAPNPQPTVEPYNDGPSMDYPRNDEYYGSVGDENSAGDELYWPDSSRGPSSHHNKPSRPKMPSIESLRYGGDRIFDVNKQDLLKGLNFKLDFTGPRYLEDAFEFESALKDLEADDTECEVEDFEEDEPLENRSMSGSQPSFSPGLGGEAE